MPQFDIDKIVQYLKPYRDKLHDLYSWNADLSKLIDMQVLSTEDRDTLDSHTSYNKEVQVKALVRAAILKSHNDDRDLFDQLSLWIIRDWGGIKTAKEDTTKLLIADFLKVRDAKFERIASVSKVAAYMYPEDFVIYDSRVAYSLNWILLSQDAGDCFFPIPDGRNSKMTAFNMDTLIRLKYVDRYTPKDLKTLTETKKYISTIDKSLYIDKNKAYKALNTLIKEISAKLWHDDAEKQKHLFYTEMLLFSIADREIFMDITNHFQGMGTLYNSPVATTRTVLPSSIGGRSIFSSIIPTVCNLEPMLHNLRKHDWNWSMLRDWERAQYRAYCMDDIITKLKRVPVKQWPMIIKLHLLTIHVHELGPHPMDIYILAYYAESRRERSRKDFIAFVKENGISDKDLSGSAIWQVGLKDGVYLGILDEDGSVLDWEFVRGFCRNRD